MKGWPVAVAAFWITLAVGWAWLWAGFRFFITALGMLCFISLIGALLGIVYQTWLAPAPRRSVGYHIDAERGAEIIYLEDLDDE